MSAVISECGYYRYRLDRTVGDVGRTIAYFGVNPSTADATIDDQTVRKWIGFTKKNGGRRFIVGNVFAFRSSNVKLLATCDDPVGPANFRYLDEIIREADILVPCWGTRTKLPAKLHCQLEHMVEYLLHAGPPVAIFGRTQSGDPKHPLLLSYKTKLKVL